MHRNGIQNYHKHHYWIDALVILALLTIGGTCWYYHDANQRTPQTTWQRGSSYKMRSSNSSSSNNPKNSNSSNKVAQPKSQTNNQPKPAPAVNRKGYTLGVFPQSMQGTWYSLDKYSDGGGKKVSKVVITPTTISYAHVPVTELHARPLKAKPAKMSDSTQNWITAVLVKGRGKDKGFNTVNVRTWSQLAGDGDDYKVLHDDGMDILSLGGGAAGLTEANYFRTVSQANNHLNQQFKGERYDRQNY